MEENREKKESNINEKPKDIDKTFNKLKDLQSLLKKESALKELCKKKYN